MLLQLIHSAKSFFLFSKLKGFCSGCMQWTDIQKSFLKCGEGHSLVHDHQELWPFSFCSKEHTFYASATFIPQYECHREIMVAQSAHASTEVLCNIKSHFNTPILSHRFDTKVQKHEYRMWKRKLSSVLYTSSWVAWRTACASNRCLCIEQLSFVTWTVKG